MVRFGAIRLRRNESDLPLALLRRRERVVVFENPFAIFLDHVNAEPLRYASITLFLHSSSAASPPFISPSAPRSHRSVDHLTGATTRSGHLGNCGAGRPKRPQIR